MPDIALDQLEASNVTPDANAPREMPVSDLNDYAPSSNMYYQPSRPVANVGEDGKPKDNPFMSFAKGIPLGMESMPGKVGKALVMFGDSIVKGTAEKQEQFKNTGVIGDWLNNWAGGYRAQNNLADRMVKAGTLMQDRNAQWLQEHHPDINQKNFWRDVGAGVPNLAAIVGVGFLTKNPGAAVAVGAGTGGTDAMLESYWRGREGGLDYKKNMEVAQGMGLAIGGLSAYGLDRFLHVSGPILSQVVKGALIQGASGASQSVVADVIQTAGGVTPYKGKESLMEIMENAAYSGAIMFTLGGVTAAPLAMAHRSTVQQGFEKMGVPPEKAKGLADQVMKEGMHNVLKSIEDDIQPTRTELDRFINPTVEKIKNGEVILGKDSATGPLDQPFVPDILIKPEDVNVRIQAAIESQKNIQEQLAVNEEQISRRQNLIKVADTVLKSDLPEEAKLGMINRLPELQGKIELSKSEDVQAFMDQQKEVISQLRAANKTINPMIRESKLTALKGDVAKMKQGFRLGRTQTRAEVANVQKQVLETLRASELDVADKGKFLASIKNIQTEGQLKDKLPEIESRIKTLEDKATVRDAVEIIKGVSVKGLPIEYQDAIGFIKSQFNLKNESAGRVIERKATADFFRRQLEENGKLDPNEARILNDAERMGLSEMSAEQVTALKNLVMQVATAGKLKSKLLTIRDAKDFQSFVADTSTKILDGETLARMSTFEEALKAQNPDFKSWSAEKLQSYMAVQLRPELMFDMMRMRPVYESMVAADTSKQEAIHLNTERMKARYLKVDIVKAMTERVNIGRFEKMPVDTAMFIYANSLNEKNASHLAGSGLTPEDIAHVKTWLDVHMPEAVKAIDAQVKYYDDVQYDRIDAVHSELKGFHMPKEDNYFPIQKLEGVAEKGEVERGLFERAYYASASPKASFAKGRVISDAAFKEFSYFNTVYRNMADVEHYVAFAKSLNDVNRLWNDPTIRDSVEQRFGETFWKSIDAMVKDVAYNGNDSYAQTFDKVFDFVRTNYVTSALGWNLMTVAKQPAAWFAGAEYVGKGWVTKASAKYITDPMKWTKFVDDNSILMKNRPMTQEREFVDLVRKQGLYQLQPFRLRDKVVQNSMFLMQAADKATADAIWLGAYDKAKANAMGHEEAVLEADRAIRRTQSMGGTLYLPMLFRGSPLMKMFTLFQNQANQNMNLLHESVAKLTEGGVTPAKAGKAASEFAMYAIAPALLIGMLTRMRAPEDDEFAWDVVNQSVGGLFGVGFLTQALSSKFMGNLTPIDATVNSLYMFLQGKEDDTKLKAALDLGGDLTGISFRNIRRIADGSMFQTPEEKKRGRSGRKSSSSFGNPGRTGR